MHMKDTHTPHVNYKLLPGSTRAMSPSIKMHNVIGLRKATPRAGRLCALTGGPINYH
jgi:hypothetical protein